MGLQEASWVSRISRCAAACDRHRGLLLPMPAIRLITSIRRTGDNSLPGDPGVPVDLQTSADPVLLDWTNWIDAGSRLSSPPCGFSPSAALTTTATPSRTTPSLAPYVCAVTAAHPALRGQLQDPGPDYLPCVA